MTHACLWTTKSYIWSMLMIHCATLTRKDYIQEEIEALKQENMELEVESEVTGFLGVIITKKPDGTIHLTQTGLIQRILAALHMADFNTKETPAEHGCLKVDKDGDQPQGTYSYPSVIGMLGYLGHTRPDTGFSTSQ
jgi:hypothetical protein